ncbi:MULTISPECIES: hypothetical protein [unclassified Thalassospira]|uniref:hypothetical protein n=1 Tax=unclassified Thalassospira TaxID=2648997 RepID=UPI0025D47444|nr:MULTISPECIES: hypothetical protein [unclassified Thalassospira]
METKITRYQSYSGTIAAGDTFAINRQGRSVTCLSASDDLEIVIDDGSRSFFTAGISMEFDEPFSKVQLHNPTAGPVTFLIATAMGKVDDNRLTASGNLKVLDPGAGGESFADVIASQADILAMMQNDEDQRVGVNSLGQSNFMLNSISTSASVLIDPSLNTNGAILRWFRGFSNTSSNHAVYIDTAAPSGPDDATKRRIYYTLGIAEHYQLEGLPLGIPSGHGLWVIGSTADSIRIQGGFDLL